MNKAPLGPEEYYVGGEQGEKRKSGGGVEDEYGKEKWRQHETTEEEE